jgi:predicted transcriptional regulator
MVKKSFTTRLDEAVLELAQRVAQAERRSVTSVLEVAVIEYAQRRAMAASTDQPSTPELEDQPAAQRD